MTWHVWTDGSCQHGGANAPKGGRGFGGWAAIVEHGGSRVVVRGRVPNTTNVRMELRAALEGLRAVPDGVAAVLHTDCTTVVTVHERWRLGEVGKLGPDGRLWLELDAELDRVGSVELWLIVRGDVDLIHQLAHTIAGAEAAAGLRGLPVRVAVDDLGGGHRIRAGMRRQVAGDPAAARVQASRRASEGRVHARACRPGLCVASCPVHPYL